MSFISSSSSLATNESSFSESSFKERSYLDEPYSAKQDFGESNLATRLGKSDLAKAHSDELDSVFPDELPHVRRDDVGEDMSDAIFKAKFRVSRPAIVVSEGPDDVADESLRISRTDLETVLANKYLDEVQFVPEDDDVTGGRRRSVDQLSGIFTLTPNLKKVPQLMNNEKNKIKKILNESPLYDPFTKRSLAMYFVTLGLDLSDYGTDIMVASILRQETSTQWWFRLTLMLILVPLFLVNLFSIFWFWQDHRNKPNEVRWRAVNGRANGLSSHNHKFSKNESRLIISTHLIFMAPLFRHFQILYFGLKEQSRRQKSQALELRHSKIEGPYSVNPKWRSRNPGHMDYYTLRKYYERDSAYLGLIKAFLQDCPQLILQLYILAVRDHESLQEPSIAFYQISSVIISLLSLSWSMVCFEQSNRWANPNKPQMTMASCLVQLFWRFFMVASRVIALALFATCFRLELFLFMGLHWGLMTLWILMMGTNFCGSAENRRRPVSEVLYNIVMGFVGIFEYLHLKDGPTRLKFLFFYSLIFVEDAALLALWFVDTTRENRLAEPEEPVPWSEYGWYTWGGLAVVPGFYSVGLFFMLAYYKLYHPNGEMPNRSQPASLF